jgi:hypothetical protein
LKIQSRVARLLPLLLLLFTFGATLAEQPRVGRAQRTEEHTLFLPFLLRQYPYRGETYLPLASSRYRDWTPPYGVEAYRLASYAQQERADELGTGWVRLNSLSWREIQPDEGGAYRWEAAADFEQELRGAVRIGLTPMLVVDDYPTWATINDPFPTACGALRAERFEAFAVFMGALVERYSQPPYNVHYWELGNEPDVDPTLVIPDNIFGCWGNASDPYYGGEHYGEMLKVVTPAIRAADPEAKVLIGGLLLASPNSPPDQGKPENFFEGILRSGAAPYFDIVPYHAYPAYTHEWLDTDRYNRAWADWGGLILGKARFLREVMARYGVDKPVSLNETGFRCLPAFSMCPDPIPAFYEIQASHLVRGFVRAAAADVGPIIWFTLDGPGWNNTGLLFADRRPKPAFLAYEEFLDKVWNYSGTPAPVSYGDGVEAYRFDVPSNAVDVVWSLDTEPDRITLPADALRAAYTREGAPIEPEIVDGNASFAVGFAPIYIQRHP